MQVLCCSSLTRSRLCSLVDGLRERIAPGAATQTTIVRRPSNLASISGAQHVSLPALEAAWLGLVTFQPLALVSRCSFEPGNGFTLNLHRPHPATNQQVNHLGQHIRGHCNVLFDLECFVAFCDASMTTGLGEMRSPGASFETAGLPGIRIAGSDVSPDLLNFGRGKVECGEIAPLRPQHLRRVPLTRYQSMPAWEVMHSWSALEGRLRHPKAEIVARRHEISRPGE